MILPVRKYSNFHIFTLITIILLVSAAFGHICSAGVSTFSNVFLTAKEQAHKESVESNAFFFEVTDFSVSLDIMMPMPKRVYDKDLKIFAQSEIFLFFQV